MHFVQYLPAKFTVSHGSTLECPNYMSTSINIGSMRVGSGWVDPTRPDPKAVRSRGPFGHLPNVGLPCLPDAGWNTTPPAPARHVPRYLLTFDVHGILAAFNVGIANYCEPAAMAIGVSGGYTHFSLLTGKPVHAPWIGTPLPRAFVPRVKAAVPRAVTRRIVWVNAVTVAELREVETATSRHHTPSHPTHKRQQHVPLPDADRMDPRSTRSGVISGSVVSKLVHRHKSTKAMTPLNQPGRVGGMHRHMFGWVMTWSLPGAMPKTKNSKHQVEPEDVTLGAAEDQMGGIEDHMGTFPWFDGFHMDNNYCCVHPRRAFLKNEWQIELSVGTI
ncbi:hypothetical protein C8R45DRAFT_934370 [Mycena sanguinolenta]|nr:hypothetical protein C8R45DRAFT_934370 [Mycena sanguinolenta]